MLIITNIDAGIHNSTIIHNIELIKWPIKIEYSILSQIIVTIEYNIPNAPFYAFIASYYDARWYQTALQDVVERELDFRSLLMIFN